MTTNLHFLVIGHIVLNIGILGYFTHNSYLAFICTTISLVFFIRQLLSLNNSKQTDPTEPPTITIN